MKRKKNMILLLACLAVLIVATIAATRLTSEGNNVTSDGKAGVIFSVNTADVDRLEWRYSEELAFTRDESGTWQYANDSAFPLDETYLKAALNAISSISASRTFEGITQWEEYGLDTPLCTLSVTVGAQVYTLSFGDETSLGGERYLTLGDGKLYLVDADLVSYFNYGLYDLLILEEVPDLSAVTAIALESGEQSWEIEYLENSGLSYSDLYVWFMDGAALDNEVCNAIPEFLEAIDLTNCVNYNAQDLSEYGLDAPLLAITVTYTYIDDADGAAKSGTCTLEFGGEEGRYARFADSNMVYFVSSTVTNTLLALTPETMLPREAVLLDWSTVDALKITLDGETHEVVKSVTTVTDDAGAVTEQTTYLLDETEVDAESFFTALDAVTYVSQAADVTPERREELRLVLRREGCEDLELVFWQYDAARCLTTLNGGSTVFVSREKVVELTEIVTQWILG